MLMSTVARSAVAARLLTLDCTGTLFEPTASVGQLYHEALHEQAALRSPQCLEAAAALSADSLNTAFGVAYGTAARARPCFGGASGGSPITSKEWWRGVVEETILGAAGSDAQQLRPVLPATFDTLFGRTFVSAKSWRLRPHALEALRAISDHRATQSSEHRMVVGVISNWDERLPLVLEALSVSVHLDFVLTSRQAAVEKPSAEIFARARELAGVPDGRAIHVGDSVATDVVGAVSAGYEAVFVKSDAKLQRLGAKERALLDSMPHQRLADLSALPELVGVSAYVCE